MSDYISRKAAVDAFFPVDPENDGSDGTTPVYLEQNYSNNEIESILWEVPAADVEPVRHGRWKVVYPDGASCEGAALRTMYALLVCSECGKTFELMRMGKPRYCVCGAKMDLEEDTYEM